MGKWFVEYKMLQPYKLPLLFLFKYQHMICEAINTNEIKQKKVTFYFWIYIAKTIKLEGH